MSPPSETHDDLHGQDEIEVSEAIGLFSLDDDPSPLLPAVEPVSSRYAMLGPLGQGSMGVVYVAKDLDLRRKVAFKTIVRSGALNWRRFLHEVQITAQLDHPNVVPVYAIEIDSAGRPSYAMKLVRGRTLKALMLEAREAVDAKRPLGEELRLAARLEYFLKICDAVSYAHDKGVIHRDLKPENVMVGRFGEVYLMDWGIAKLVRDTAPDDSGIDIGEELDHRDAHRRTRFGAVVGTPAYMSPEQANGQLSQIGFHSDQFGLGLLLHELVWLEPAYRGDDAILVLAKSAAARVDKPEGSPGESVPLELSAIIARATQASPIDRYPSVAALEADIRRFLRGEETEAAPDRPLRRLRRAMVRHQQVTLGIVAAVILVSAVAVIWAGWNRQVVLAEERLRSQSREQAVVELVGRVSSRSQHIDNHFLWYEGMLEGIAAAAVYALEHGTPGEGPFYEAQDFRSPERAPSDLTFSPQYRKPVSAAHPVYKVAPGVPASRWEPDLQLLGGLRDTLRHVFLVAPGDPSPPVGRTEQRARIVSDPRSMRWAYVALERSGLMYMFPGAEGWDEKYDARTRPWYREAADQRGRIWGKPYVDLMGQGRLVSCLLPLYDASDRFLGVAGIDLQFNALLDELLKMDDLSGYQAAYLLADGQVMLQTTAENDPVVIPPTEAIDDGIDFGTFGQPEVVEGVVSGRPGHVLAGNQLYIWSPLRHLGWTYVVAVDASSLR